jgi:polyphosphate kinase 2 (PPK2 family)
MIIKDFDKTKPEDKDTLKAEIKELRAKLLGQQQQLRDMKLPIIVLVEGWAAAGKGSLINELISEIDPRFYNVITPKVVPETEERYPFMYQYASAIPENGKIMFYDSGWMEGAVRNYLHRYITKDQYKERIRSINEFERQLKNGGYIVLKLFQHISEKEQRKRITNLLENPATEWRVTEEDLWQHREYKTFRETYDAFID